MNLIALGQISHRRLLTQRLQRNLRLHRRIDLPSRPLRHSPLLCCDGAAPNPISQAVLIPGSTSLGEKRPVFMGASGQCLISALSASEWRELEKHISESEEARKRQLSMEVIRERLRFVEENGWAFGQGEWASEAAGAAAPIRNKD